MDEQVISTGALPSPLDARTVKHEDLVTGAAPLVTGGMTYAPEDHEHQHGVGICTAISLVQNREKATGRKYSPDFQYLLQKKFYDNVVPGYPWMEGSSIMSALKVGKNIGFLPIERWTGPGEAERYNSYENYVAKLQAIPDTEVARLITFCVDKIPGYAVVDASDPQKIAAAIADSEAGVLCMYGCGSTWWLPSWLAAAINPLRKPKPYTSYHAIGMTFFDYSFRLAQRLANTWGPTWCAFGNADIDFSTYAPIEVWAILRTAPIIPPYLFTKDLRIGMRNADVIELQRRIAVTPQTGYFGPLTLAAVIRYQKAHGITATGYVGPLTRGALNS